MSNDLLSIKIKPDWEGFLDCINRKGTPDRTYYSELFIDWEIQNAIIEKYGLLADIKKDEPFYELKREIELAGFLGYDYIRCSIEGMNMEFNYSKTEDTANLKHEGGRNFMNETKGPVSNWEEFEKYPWPDLTKATTKALEWTSKNLPDDMCIISHGVASFAECLMWIMGYETLCYALFDQRDLVKAIYNKILEMEIKKTELYLQFDRVKVIWGSDDMGFKTGTLISPDDMREFVLTGHKKIAQMAHNAGRPYFLHSCGNLEKIMDDLIDDVKIDAKHSFEDTIENVIDVKQQVGDKITILGGIDVDFLCRASEEQIRERVRNTLDKCLVGGGYCLGSGNSVANYIPVDNFLYMLDEGRKHQIS